VDGEEDRDPDISRSVLNTVLNIINNEFVAECLAKVVRLLNVHLMLQ
jgi:hypothetical protein